MIGALAIADFRERSRRPAYAVVLLGAVALGVLGLPAPGSHWQIFQLGDYRGRYSTPYAGTVTALAGAVWLSLAGFYVVKNAIARDVETGVGQILAATPLRRAPYLAGKFLGNLAVLASMTAALAATALVMQLWRGEDRHVSLPALLAPFVLITVPVLALTAAAAVFFETVPGLRSGTGNIVWLLFWMISSIALQGGGGLDVFGTGRVIGSMQADIARTFGDHHPGEFGVGLVERDAPLKVFFWSGADFGGSFLAQRAVLLAIAVALAVAGALWFHRFDPARAMPRRRLGHLAPRPSEPVPRWESVARRPATPVRFGPAPFRLVWAELRVLLAGVSVWWWVVAAGLNVIAAVRPAAGLELCWVWPVLLWSRLGTQETSDDLAGLLTACPRRRGRIVAGWASGVVLTAVVAVVPLARQPADAAGILIIPALAYFLGTVTRSSRPFQVIYLLWWYAIINGAAAISFTRPLFLAPAVALVLLAAGVREPEARPPIAQQLRNSGDWLSNCPRGETNARCRSPPTASTRWQFWNASFAPKWRSRPPRMASLAGARSSCPRSSSDGGGTVRAVGCPYDAGRNGGGGARRGRRGAGGRGASDRGRRRARR
jgi:hypothetical protein